MRGIELTDFPIDLMGRRDAEHLFDCPLADEDMPTADVLDDDGHSSTLEIEGNLVYLLEIVLDAKIAVHLEVLEHRDVQKVSQASLVIAVEVGVFENLIRLRASDIEMSLQNDLVLRQRPGLVGAEHIHGAEILD